MTERVTRRAALAGSVALPLAPAVAVAREEGPEAPGPIETLMEEFRRRIDWVDSQDGGDDSTVERQLDWADEPLDDLTKMTPATLREFAAKHEAAMIRTGDRPESIGETAIGLALANDAKAILGLPATVENHPPSTHTVLQFYVALERLGVHPRPNLEQIVECAPDAGHGQAAFLTGVRALRSSNCVGLR